MTLSGVNEPRWCVYGGSVTGAEHRRARRNNQDGLALSGEGAWRAAVVTDGCSSGRASEVGARLGAAWLAEAIVRSAEAAQSAEALAEAVTRELVAWLRAVAASFPEERRQDVVAEMLLFSYLAAAVGPERAVVFGVGDGVFAIDGAVTALSSGPDNAPPYAGYGVLADAPAPVVHADLPSAAMRSILVATDGALDLTERLGEFVDDARYLKNPSLVQKRLVVLDETAVRLHDDTTIAVVRSAPWT
jgi:hypothetical protein